MTPAEKILWTELRNRRFIDHKFRRQHPIGKWIVDFFSYKARLAIELDGSIHDNQREEDEWRQKLIENHNIRFIRFRNEEVETNIDAVLQEIASKIDDVKE